MQGKAPSQGSSKDLGKIVHGTKARQSKARRQGSARHLGMAVEGT